MPFSRCAASTGVLLQVGACCRDHQVLRFDYVDTEGAQSLRRVEPHRLVDTFHASRDGGARTHRAIDMIPKDVLICDWHYERPDQTAVYFAMKGFRVVTCPWRKPNVALVQLNDMLRYREHATPEMKARYYGMMQTVWSGADIFLKGFKDKVKDENGGIETPWHTFTVLYDQMMGLEKE